LVRGAGAAGPSLEGGCDELRDDRRACSSKRRDPGEQRLHHRRLLGDRRRLLGSSIVSPVVLSACAATSWKELLHDYEIDLTQCGTEDMDSPVNGYPSKSDGQGTSDPS
jgi:hypothetical protein